MVYKDDRSIPIVIYSNLRNLKFWTFQCTVKVDRFCRIEFTGRTRGWRNFSAQLCKHNYFEGLQNYVLFLRFHIMHRMLFQTLKFRVLKNRPCFMFNLFTKPFDYYVTSLTSEQLLSTYRWYQSNHITHNDIENNDYNKNFVTLWSYTFYVTSKSRLVGTISTSRLNNIKTDLPGKIPVGKLIWLLNFKQFAVGKQNCGFQ